MVCLKTYTNSKLKNKNKNNPIDYNVVLKNIYYYIDFNTIYNYV